jgi:hypothetical protein
MRRIIVVSTILLMSGVWLMSIAEASIPRCESGDCEGYASAHQEPGNYSNGSGIISVDTDKWVSWNGPKDSTFTCRPTTNLRLTLPRGRRALKALPG